MRDDERERVVFAWLPTRLDDGAWIWLAAYRLTERAEPDCGGWTAGLWIVSARNSII